MLRIVINSKVKIMICTVCSSGIPPKSMYDHVRQGSHNDRKCFKKGQKLAFATKEFCNSIIAEYELGFQKPVAIIPVIPGLPVKDGLFCCETCGYAVQAEKSIKRHQHGECAGNKYFKGPGQTFLPSSKRDYFAVTLPPSPHLNDGNDSASNTNLLDPVFLFEKQFSFNPYENTPIQVISHTRDMNIFLASDNWLTEVKGMTGGEIFAISHKPLPDLRKKVREVVKSYTSSLVEDLAKAAGPAEMLSIGDYNK